MNKFLLSVLLGVTFIFAAACRPTPAKEIVVNKGADGLANLIEQKTNGLFKIDAATWKEEFKIYESHYAKVPVYVFVDAVIRVPDTDKFPVANIKQRNFNKSDLKTATDIFFKGDIKLGGSEYMTAEEITQAILDIKRTIHKLQIDPESDSKGAIANLEYKIKEYEYRLSNSKEFSELTDIDWDKIDYDIGSVALSSLDNAKTSTISIETSENSGECRMAYFENKYYYLLNSGGMSVYQPFSEARPKGTQIDLAQAKELADGAAAKFDEDMRYYGYSICAKEDIQGMWEAESLVEKECYVLHYTRQIRNVPTTYASQSAQYSAEYGKPWNYEFLTFFIDDTGIIAFIWDNPKRVSEIVNNSVAMLPFEDIKEHFKRQISIRNASMDNLSDYYDHTTFKIDRIELGMTIVKKKDTDDEFMAVPAWDFFGNYSWTYTDKALEEWKEPNKTYETKTWPQLSELTINAIDGSVIDRSAGY